METHQLFSQIEIQVPGPTNSVLRPVLLSRQARDWEPLDFEWQCGQTIWEQDPPALLSFHELCLCSDPSAKGVLHCLRDLNLVALPVSEQAL